VGRKRYWSEYYREDVHLYDSELYELIEKYVSICLKQGHSPEVTTREFEVVKNSQSIFEHVYFTVTEYELEN